MAGTTAVETLLATRRHGRRKAAQNHRSHPRRSRSYRLPPQHARAGRRAGYPRSSARLVAHRRAPRVQYRGSPDRHRRRNGHRRFLPHSRRFPPGRPPSPKQLRHRPLRGRRISMPDSLRHFQIGRGSSLDNKRPTRNTGLSPRDLISSMLKRLLRSHTNSWVPHSSRLFAMSGTAQTALAPHPSASQSPSATQPSRPKARPDAAPVLRPTPGPNAAGAPHKLAAALVLVACLPAHASPPLCRQATLEAELTAGQLYSQPLGNGLRLYFQPIHSGWITRVLPHRRPASRARLRRTRHAPPTSPSHPYSRSPPTSPSAPRTPSAGTRDASDFATSPAAFQQA